MPSAIATSITLWLLIVAAGLGLVISGFVFIVMMVDSYRDWDQIPFSLLGLLASVGLLYTSLTLAGFSVVALWILRIAGIFGASAGLIGSLTALADSRADGEEKTLTVVFTVPLIVLPVCGIFSAIPGTHGGGVTPLVERTPTPPSAALAPAVGWQVPFWHNLALIVLATCAVVFLFLLIDALRRGIPLGVESQWGGFGGGLSGWQITPTLSYLVGLLIFGILFYLLTLHEQDAATYFVQKQTAQDAAPAKIRPGAAGAQSGDSKTAMGQK